MRRRSGGGGGIAAKFGVFVGSARDNWFDAQGGAFGGMRTVCGSKDWFVAMMRRFAKGAGARGMIRPEVGGLGIRHAGELYRSGGDGV